MPSEKSLPQKEVYLFLENQYQYYYQLYQKKFTLFFVVDFVLIMLYLLSRYTALISKKIDWVLVLAGILICVLWITIMWIGSKFILTIQKDKVLAGKKISEEYPDQWMPHLSSSDSFRYSELLIFLQLLTSIVGMLLWLVLMLIAFVNNTDFDPNNSVPLLLFGFAMIAVIVIIAKGKSTENR